MVVIATKFTHGAYIVVIAVPVLVTLFYVVKRHYERVSRVLEPQGPFEMEDIEKTGRLSSPDHGRPVRGPGELSHGAVPVLGPLPLSR